MRRTRLSPAFGSLRVSTFGQAAPTRPLIPAHAMLSSMRTLSSLRSWMRRSKPPTSASPDAQDPAPIVVSSLPRSGSTLVQRLLNVHPQVTIWGEHNAFLRPLSEAHELITGPSGARNLASGYRDAHLVVGPLKDPAAFIAWVSPFSPESFSEHTRTFIQGLFTACLPPDTTWGFKEVRYSSRELEFFHHLFPRSRFLFIIRDLEDQVVSHMSAFRGPEGIHQPEGVERARQRVATLAARWFERHEDYLRFINAHEHACAVLQYADVRNATDTVSQLFESLNLSVPDQDLLDQVLAEPAGAADRLWSAKYWTDRQLGIVRQLVREYSVDEPRHLSILRQFDTLAI